jgi:hypothetical protein
VVFFWLFNPDDVLVFVVWGCVLFTIQLTALRGALVVAGRVLVLGVTFVGVCAVFDDLRALLSTHGDSAYG